MKIYDLQLRINRIASNIKSLRIAKGYSQEYMGMKLNMSQNTFSKIELGHVELTVKRLIQIAEVLEVDVHDLLCSDNSQVLAISQ
ncbi:helix-turn-helix transcriptional regulator [Mucilaginibacter sp. CAU 1740]|uniref:helix-turn-helix domain-containing protein n=1 Tax=Mucilaginibacter sp. CAU 1740 TaxID=3140365 RepID=UPI00325AAD11